MILDAYIQARMGSTRLPGKMMLKLGEKTILEHVIDRVRQFKGVRNILLLTEGYKEDDCLFKIALEQDILNYSLATPIDRYVFACEKFKPNWFLRICGDSPFISVEMTNQMIDKINDFHDYIAYEDYYPNTNRPSSSGICCEAVNAKSFMHYIDNHNEHVTYNLYAKQDVLFLNFPYSNIHVSIDTKEDYDYVTKIYNHFGYIPEHKELKKYIGAIYV